MRSLRVGPVKSRARLINTRHASVRIGSRPHFVDSFLVSTLANILRDIMWDAVPDVSIMSQIFAIKWRSRRDSNPR
ncbi:hypothetical protein SPHINGOR109_50581 [Sphingorhabdus sp. 109]|nr:hypothetical protein SPHINGOR109_50581 [Sphingorhabdus sp. 109]